MIALITQNEGNNNSDEEEVQDTEYSPPVSDSEDDLKAPAGGSAHPVSCCSPSLLTC
jgi:hypothetical protein